MTSAVLKSPKRTTALAFICAACTTLGACERQERPIQESDRRHAQISIFNASHDVLSIETQSIHSNYRVDCALVADDPIRFLRADHLTSRLGMELLSGEERPLDHESGGSSSPGPQQPCRFSFITPADDRLDPIAASWPRDLPTKEFFRDVDAPPDIPPEEQTVIVEAIYDDVADGDRRPWRHRPCQSSESLSLWSCPLSEYEQLLTPPQGATYHWSVLGEFPRQRIWEPAPLDEMALDDDDEQPQCRTGRSRQRLVWDTPPTGSWEVTEVHEIGSPAGPGDDVDGASPSGCYEATLRQDEEDHVQWWSFCGSQRLAHRLESAGHSGLVFVEFFRSSRADAPPSAYESLTIDLERRTDEGERYEDEIFELVRGHGVPEHFGLAWTAEPRMACEARREFADCDKIILPTLLRVGAEEELLEVLPGETIDLEPTSTDRIEERRRVEFVRGFHRAVADRTCQHDSLSTAALAQTGAYVELIYYSGVTAVEN